MASEVYSLFALSPSFLIPMSTIELPPDKKRPRRAPPKAPAIPVSRHAVLSVLAGILSLPLVFFLLGLVPAVAAVVCGHLALVSLARAELVKRGRGLAVIGLTAGYLSLAIFPLTLVFYSTGATWVHTKYAYYLRHPGAAASIEHATALYNACERYALDHRDQYPETWNQLEGVYLKPSELQQYLSSPHDPDFGVAAFKLVKHDRPVLKAVENQVVVITEVAQAGVKEIVVVYANGEWKVIKNPNRG